MGWGWQLGGPASSEDGGGNWAGTAHGHHRMCPATCRNVTLRCALPCCPRCHVTCRPHG